MQIVAFDADELADGSGYAPITWISKQLINSYHRMNPALEQDPSDSSKCRLGTGSVGGWKNSEMRSWLQSDIKPLIPSNVRDAIKPVTKYSASNTTSIEAIRNDISVDDVWIPSWREICGSGSDLNSYEYECHESEGPTYALFATIDSRVKKMDSRMFKKDHRGIKKIGDPGSEYWWLRSASSGVTYFDMIMTVGSYYINYSESICAVALGFCT